jgi:hypothetical protein
MTFGGSTMKKKEYEMVPAGSLETLETILRAMERRLQLTMVGWGLSVIVLGLVTAFALGIVRETLRPAEIRARTIQVVDAAGRTRAYLGAGADGPALTLYDDAGKSRLGLVVTSDGPRVVLADGFEAQRALLEVSASGIPDFSLSDSIGFQSILTPSTVLFHKDKKIFWASPLFPLK